MTFDKTDALAGLLFILAGLWFGAQSLALDIGTARQMGPGYFPAILSAALIVLGLVVMAGSLRGEAQEIGRIAFRGILFILPAPIAFALTVRGLGFVPSVFLATLIASRASARMGWPAALVLAVCVTAFSTAVFSYALNLPFRRFGPWLGF